MTVKYDDLIHATNAKYMDDSTLVDRFVFRPELKRLCTTGNAYVLGPRGCGKTTMFRMLQEHTAKRWNSTEKGAESPITPAYSGVYFPCELVSVQQTEYPRIRFYVDALRAILQTMRVRLDSQVLHPIALSRRDEEPLIKRLEDVLGIHFDCFALPQLIDVLNGASLYVQYESIDGKSQASRVARDFVTLFKGTSGVPFLVKTIETINDAINDHGRMWALLIDETENLPQELHKDIFLQMRDGGTLLQIKAGGSPIGVDWDLMSVNQKALPGNDYEPISLYGSRDSNNFLGTMWEIETKGTAYEGTQFSSILENTPDLDKNARKRIIQDSLDYDPTFAEWADTNAVDSSSIDLMSDADYASKVRKIAPLLIFRSENLKLDSSHATFSLHQRSRRSMPSLYDGYRNINRVLEGNPRWIKWFFQALLQQNASSSTQGPKVFSSRDQYLALKEVYSRLKVMFKAYPSTASMFQASSRSIPDCNLDDVITRCSRFFHQELIGSFKADPVGHFRFDDDSTDLESVIRHGLYLGAMFPANSPSDPHRWEAHVSQSLVGQRFRLAFAFALDSTYPLMLRQGKPADLTSILDHSSDDPTIVGDSHQEALF